MAVDRRIDQLLASPLGRQFALHLVDPMAELTLDGLSEDEAKRAVSPAVAASVPLPEGPDGLLAALARDTFDFGFSGEDEGLWPLSQAAKEELRPVADALVAAAGPLGWWEPVDRADQGVPVVLAQ